MTESTELPRETGAEKASRTCPNCGGPMNVEERATGSLVATCPACDAKAVEDVQEPSQQAAEQVPVRETGTNTDQGEEQA